MERTASERMNLLRVGGAALGVLSAGVLSAGCQGSAEPATVPADGRRPS